MNESDENLRSATCFSDAIIHSLLRIYIVINQKMVGYMMNMIQEVFQDGRPSHLL